jgi:hypothetical protein
MTAGTDADASFGAPTGSNPVVAPQDEDVLYAIYKTRPILRCPAERGLEGR